MIDLPAWIKSGLGICLLSLATACASVPKTDTSADAAAKTFQPTPGMANVYLSRESNGFGDTLVAQTQLDGALVGGLAPNTYILISVAPGHHTLSTFGPTNEEEAALDAVAGNNYFFDVSITYAGPMMRHRHIAALTDADGRKAVLSDSRAVATTSNPN